MTPGLFASIPVPAIFLLVAALLLVACEAGFLVGRRHHREREDDKAHGSLGPMVGGLLGTLGFLLAFTFSMAATQHGNRKTDVLNEANAIVTAYLRADLIDARRGAEVRRLLREYVDTRLQATQPGADIQRAIDRSVGIHHSLWTQVAAAAVENPGSNTSMAVRSINELIDLHEHRMADALRARIPAGVWYGLMAIAVLAMGTLGLQVGLAGKRRLVGIVPICLAFAVLFTLVVDLNSPNRGFITVGQEAMYDVRAEINH